MHAGEEVEQPDAIFLDFEPPKIGRRKSCFRISRISIQQILLLLQIECTNTCTKYVQNRVSWAMFRDPRVLQVLTPRRAIGVIGGGTRRERCSVVMLWRPMGR